MWRLSRTSTTEWWGVKPVFCRPELFKKNHLRGFSKWSRMACKNFSCFWNTQKRFFFAALLQLGRTALKSHLTVVVIDSRRPPPPPPNIRLHNSSVFTLTSALVKIPAFCQNLFRDAWKVTVVLISEILSYTFYIIDFQYLCRTEEGQYLPVEVALVEFSLKDGIKREMHKFVKHRKNIVLCVGRLSRFRPQLRFLLLCIRNH